MGRWEFDENGDVRFVEEPDGKTENQPTTDGSYHYSYRKTGEGKYEGVPKEQPVRQTRKEDNRWHWILIILGFVAFWPVGLGLLVLELTGRWPGNPKTDKEFQRMTNAVKNAAGQAVERAKSAHSTASPGNYGQTIDQVQSRLEREKAQRAEQNKARAAQAAEAKQAAADKQAEKARRRMEKKAKRDQGLQYGLGHVTLFRWLGGIIAGVFGFSFIMDLIDQLTYFQGIGSLLSSAVTLLAFTLIGVTLLGVAGIRKRKLKKFLKYMTMVGDQERVSIAPLAEAMGVSEKQAEKDLEEMLDRNFWDSGYVDAARQMLVLSGHLEAEEPVVDQEIPETDDQTGATLRRIRQVNDAIADPDMSEKIFKIEELTAKIFRLLEERPEKAGELRSFMSYYLPQTLKILESYSKMEAQGIEGENITEAKAKIEGMMDKLVDGYETQLDKLFADDVLDISADLKVMEQMLEKDGLAMDELKL